MVAAHAKTYPACARSAPRVDQRGLRLYQNTSKYGGPILISASVWCPRNSARRIRV